MSRNKVVSTHNNSINPLESLINLLPCNRPIKSIQLIENVNDCPENFIPLHKTLDSDADADIFKENILFGKRNTRYLCVSKVEGFENYILDKIKIINSNENLANDGFISIKNTSDTNQRAWRKKQLVYKLSKTENVTDCITDIVILTKYKSPAPEGFIYLGELERVHVCYKTTPIKLASLASESIIDFTKQIENLKIHSNTQVNVNANAEHYYESLNLSYQLPASSPINHRPTPLRQAPLPPISVDLSNINSNNGNTGTLSHYHHECVGIPFVLNSKVLKLNCSFELPNHLKCAEPSDALDYDFNLERQILCSTRSENRKSSSTNPFF